jgi:hypothetical protein
MHESQKEEVTIIPNDQYVVMGLILLVVNIFEKSVFWAFPKGTFICGEKRVVPKDTPSFFAYLPRSNRGLTEEPNISIAERDEAMME